MIVFTRINEFNDIRKTYVIDKSSGTRRSSLKNTDSHLNPGLFEKMTCKLALQVFSHTVAATMKTSITTGQLSSKTALTSYSRLH